MGLIGLEIVLVIAAQRRKLILLAQEAIADDKDVEVSAHETAKSIIRRADDRLAAHIEARVHQHGASGAIAELR